MTHDRQDKSLAPSPGSGRMANESAPATGLCELALTQLVPARGLGHYLTRAGE